MIKKNDNLKYWIWLTLAILFLASCAAGTRCVSETDKHIKGQRHKYEYNYSKCPKGGSYYRWLFFIKR